MTVELPGEKRTDHLLGGGGCGTNRRGGVSLGHSLHPVGKHTFLRFLQDFWSSEDPTMRLVSALQVSAERQRSER